MLDKYLRLFDNYFSNHPRQLSKTILANYTIPSLTTTLKYQRQQAKTILHNHL